MSGTKRPARPRYVKPIELVCIECGLLISVSVKQVSPQNVGFIRATELAPRLFVGKAKPVFMEIELVFYKETY